VPDESRSGEGRTEMPDGNQMPGGARVTMRPAGVAGLLVDIATECGVSKPTDFSANAQVTTPPPPRRALLRKCISASQGAVYAKSVMLLAPVLFALTACGSSASTSSDPPTSSRSPNFACASQILGIVRDVLSNPNSGAQNEANINGIHDPFIMYSNDIEGVFVLAQNQEGTKTASEKALAAAEKICMDNGNPIRPNYPTDGTYPGQP